MGLPACYAPGEEVPLRNLSNRYLSLYVRQLYPVNADEATPKFEVQIGLLYDQDGAPCKQVPSKTRVAFNKTSIELAHNAYAGRGGGCGTPVFTRRLVELPTGPNGVVTMTDGDLTIRMEVEGFLMNPEIEPKEGAFTQGDFNSWIDLEPADFEYSGMKMSFYPIGADDSLDVPSFVVENDYRILDAGRIGMPIPATAPTGTLLLHFQANISATTFKTCENAAICTAQRPVDAKEKVRIVDGAL